MTTLSPGSAWGVRTGRLGPRSVEQVFALIVGLVYLVLGIIGLIATRSQPLISRTDVTLFGIIHVDPLHCLVLLFLGLLSLFAALVLTPPATEGVNLAIAGALILVAILGYLGDLDDLLSIPGQMNPNIVLYFVLGIVTLLFAGPTGIMRRD